MSTARVRPISPRMPFILVMVLFLAIACSGLATAAGTLTITCLDVGQGDATLIQSPSGQTLLFDGGPHGTGTSVIVPYLNLLGIDTLDYMMASHYHADHVGGLDEVYTQTGVDQAVYDRGWSYTTLTYNSYANTVAPMRQTLTPGQVIDLGEGVTATCVALNSNGQLSPPFDNGSYENEYDVCLVVNYGSFSFFVAGDLTGNPASGYKDIETSVAPLVGDVDVYQVNHHGSYSSSVANFLQTVQAEVSIISVGSNSYGHPHQVVLDRLVTYGSFVYQTETGSGGTLPATDLTVVGGHVVITTDGLETYTVDGDLWQLDESGASPAEMIAQPGLLMRGNVPNPFNPTTEIRFFTGSHGPGILDIFDVAGRRVVRRQFTAVEGDNSLRWAGRDASGRILPGGLYLYSVSTADGQGQGRMLLLK